MPRYAPLTRRRFLQLSSAGLTGAAVSGTTTAAEGERAVFVHPATPGADVAAAVRASGGAVTHDYAALDFVAARIPEGGRRRLERDRRVRTLERDARIGGDQARSGTFAGSRRETDGGVAGIEGDGEGPAVRPRGASDITAESATLRGEVTDLGGGTEVDVHFEARSVDREAWAALGERTLHAPGEFETDVALEAGAGVYEFRVVAESGAGSVTSGAVPFGNERGRQESSWGRDRIFGDSALATRETYATATGGGVNVGILDTGIQHDHPALAGNVAGGVNFSSGETWADDDTGHGTHVAGIAAAADNGLGTIGVAPDATLWSVKVFHGGSGHLSDVVAGIDWCMANGVEIISMSLSLYGSDSVTTAIETAYEAGHLVVTSAANERNDGDGDCDEDTILYPGDHQATVTVTAMDPDDAIAAYSSVGPAGEVMAPGTDITAPVPDGDYGRRSGTSMACPMVSGVAALAWEARDGDGPDASVRDDVRAAIQSEAEPVLDTCEEGAGLVRADRVVDALGR